MRSIPLQARPVAGPFRSRRLLALVGDDRLVEQLRVGNEAAFEVAFERHSPGILSFSRHMLGSREEAEDVVQHTFAAAHRALLGEEREIALKPWLYTVARNRCVSLLRARREEAAEAVEPSTAGLVEEVERRAELRELLSDLADLPAEQRAALLLAEVADLSHAEAAGVLGCDGPRVKALVYRARQSLLERRHARATPCDEIREQLASLRGGALRRNELRHHLRGCAGCRAFRAKVKQQRGQLAVALPVVPSLGLKSSVLGAVGLGGGSAGGATAVAALGGAGSTAPVGATIAKLAIVGVLAGGVAGDAVVRKDSPEPVPVPGTGQVAPDPSSARSGASRPAATPVERGGPADARPGAKPRRPRSKRETVVPELRGPTNDGSPSAPPRGAPRKPVGPEGRKPAKSAPRSRSQGRARGPESAPPTSAPVRRGPPEQRGKPSSESVERARPVRRVP